MDIHGFTKTTLLDYPGRVAATIFCGGCNFRCPFCHNFDLVLNPNIFAKEDETKILEFLNKRFGILTGVCVTGGEPTLQPDLATFLGKIKDMNYMIKLDTNGYRPDVLESLIKDKLIDYVAMDIKAGRNSYPKATGINNIDISLVDASIRLLSKNTIDYEFRTTVVKGIHTDEDFLDIASWLPCDCAYYLQNYKATMGIDTNYKCGSFTYEELVHIKDIVSKKISSTSIRGTD